MGLESDMHFNCMGHKRSHVIKMRLLVIMERSWHNSDDGEEVSRD